MKTQLIRKITSIADLEHEAHGNEKFAQLAKLASFNLGGPLNDLGKAIQWLKVNAMEESEDGVVGEINFCRDQVE